MDSVGYPDFDACISGRLLVQAQALLMLRPARWTACPEKPEAASWLEVIKPAFEANVGQADPQVRFLSRGRGAQLFLTRQRSSAEVRNISQRDTASAAAGGQR